MSATAGTVNVYPFVIDRLYKVWDFTRRYCVSLAGSVTFLARGKVGPPAGDLIHCRIPCTLTIKGSGKFEEIASWGQELD